MEKEIGSLKFSAGEFKAAMDLMTGPVVRITYDKGCHALKLQCTSQYACYVHLEDMDSPDDGEKEIDGLLWYVTRCQLQPIAQLIPADTLLWEKRALSLDCEILDYDLYMGRIKNRMDSRKEDDRIRRQLWTENPEYRQLKRQHTEAKDHIIDFDVMFCPGAELEFFICSMDGMFSQAEFKVLGMSTEELEKTFPEEVRDLIQDGEPEISY
jgi:hypothetical protein